MKNWSKPHWLEVFCKIQPSIEAGMAGFNTAWNVAVRHTFNNSRVLESYYQYLLRGKPVLTETEFDTCVHNAEALNFSLEFILEHAGSYKDKKLTNLYGR